MRLLLPTKPFLWTSFNHFITNSCTCHKTTSGVKFDSIFELYVPDSCMTRNFGNWTTISGILSQFSTAHAQKRHKITFGQMFIPNLKFHGPFYTNTNFGSASAKIYTCFARKTAFIMQNFRNLGNIRGGVTKPPKGTSLPDFARFEPSILQIRSRVFAPGARKKGQYKKSQRGYISRICGEFPTQPNSTKIGIRVGVVDIINQPMRRDEIRGWWRWWPSLIMIGPGSTKLRRVEFYLAR